ncbi:MAG: hypothetical protein GF398_13690 [Chitinivibrionales bacterium]|nr:hypothetical protein [Chitinivibrionales bacterium]
MCICYNRAGHPCASATGYYLGLTPTLKAKTGPFILLNSFEFAKVYLSVDKPYYLEVRTHELFATGDISLTNDLNACYELSSATLCGINYHFVRVIETQRREHRLSAIALFLPQLSGEDGKKIPRSALAAQISALQKREVAVREVA